MPRHDNYNTLKAIKAMEANVVNDDTDGTGEVVDLRGYEAAMLVVNVGESGDTLSGSVKLNLELKHGDESNLSDAEDVAVADMLGEAGTTDGLFAVIDADGEDGQVYVIGYVGNKRYVRFDVDTTGTHTNGTPIAAEWILGGKSNMRVEPQGATPG